MRNVPGRKTDVSDCQWLQYLHSVGLLRASFRPEACMCALRSIFRHRDSLVKASSSYVLRMQKSLDQMNLKLHCVISDITGVTGTLIINAILAGERDPHALAKLKNQLIRADEETIAKALDGNYLPEHLFTLKQSLASYTHCQTQIEECDKEIQKMLKEFDDQIDVKKYPLPPSNKGKKSRKPAPYMRQELYRKIGVDLTMIDGVSIQTAMSFLTEVGPDLSRFPSEKHFVSWLGLCAGNKKSSGKQLSSRSPKVENRFSIALRMAASTLKQAKSFLGEYYRRMKYRLGPPKAITATAAKLARIIYVMVKNKTVFDPSIFIAKQKQREKNRVKNLHKMAKELGFKVVAIQGPAEGVS